MALEDFTTYTEVDEGDDITVTEHKCDVSTMIRNVTSYVRKDYGVDHFGDFEHLLDIYVSAGDTNSLGLCWSMSNGNNTYQSQSAAHDGFFIYLNEASGSLIIGLVEAGVAEDSYTGSFSTPYYLTVKRVGTTLTCKIYSDAARTNLLDTLTLIVQTTKYRYIAAIGSRQAAGTAAITYYSENLDLQEAAAAKPLSFGIIF